MDRQAHLHQRGYAYLILVAAHGQRGQDLVLRRRRRQDLSQHHQKPRHLHRQRRPSCRSGRPVLFPPVRLVNGCASSFAPSAGIVRLIPGPLPAAHEQDAALPVLSFRPTDIQQCKNPVLHVFPGGSAKKQRSGAKISKGQSQSPLVIPAGAKLSAAKNEIPQISVKSQNPAHTEDSWIGVLIGLNPKQWTTTKRDLLLQMRPATGGHLSDKTVYIRSCRE